MNSDTQITKQFTPDNYDLGQMAPGAQATAVYTRDYVEGDPKIVSVKASCGCSAPTWVQNRILVTYTAPTTRTMGMLEAGEFVLHDSKYIKVVLSDNSETSLTFNAQVHFS